ncbi:MAG: GTPase Era [Actinobacteria bacterium]|nr:GTPase Era [Actinomycetota bacterium]
MTADRGADGVLDTGARLRSGFCSIVGRPNVGKSTLLNALIGVPLVITTPVPQTTRHAVRGVLHDDGVQVVFVDTPGLHKARTLLGDRLNEVARDALSDVDVLAFVVDGASGVGRGDEFVADLLAPHADRTIAVVNKIDRLGTAAQLPALDAVSRLGDWAEIVPVSAQSGDGVEIVRRLIVERMPEGPPYFPPDQITDQTIEHRIAERIREQAIIRMREDVPHSVAVLVDELLPGTSDDVTVVHATIFVERDSQKGIVIGRRGALLRDIGTDARPEIERLLGTRVYLELRVKLLKDWQGDPRALNRLGY